MKEMVEDDLIYEELTEKIKELNLNEKLKEGLNDVNNNINKLKKLTIIIGCLLEFNLNF